MLELTFAFNPAPVDRALEAFQTSLADYSPAFAQIADDFREMVAEQFASQGRAGGTPWVELAPATRRRRHSSTAILYDTGALLRSLTDPGSANHVEELDGDSLILGSRLPYALFHQTGTGRGFERPYPLPGKGPGLPMRPLIVVSPERGDVWVEMLRQQLEGNTLLLGGKELA